jgi:hypothetical protein
MSAFQMYLDPELEQAVLLGAITLAEAWLLQDEYLMQQSEYLELPMEFAPLLLRLHLLQWHNPERMLQ